MSDEPLTVSRVAVSNYEKIEFLDVTLETDLTVISGNNKQGKSSFLHAVGQLFKGKAARSGSPVHDGAEFAATKVEIRDAAGALAFTIEQEIVADGGADRLVIRDAEGFVTAKNQSWLKSLVGRGLALDPAEFMEPAGARTVEAADKLRMEMLFRILPELEVALKTLKTRREDFYKRRTLANADRERLTGKMAALGMRKKAPAEVDLAAKRDLVSKSRNWSMKLDAAKTRVAQMDKEIEELRTRFNERAAQRKELVLEMSAAVEKYGQPADVTALDAEIAAGQESNIHRERILAANASYDETLKELAAAKKSSDDLSAKIDDVDKAKAKALSEARFPLPGLSVSDAEVIFEGKPYSQRSDAERLEIAFAVCAAEKPQIGLALIDRGEVLDTEAVERVREVSKRLGIRTLMARRSPDVANKVELVAGRVKP